MPRFEVAISAADDFQELFTIQCSVRRIDAKRVGLEDKRK